jgi:hypothetical protein
MEIRQAAIGMGNGIIGREADGGTVISQSQKRNRIRQQTVDAGPVPRHT